MGEGGGGGGRYHGGGGGGGGYRHGTRNHIRIGKGGNLRTLDAREAPSAARENVLEVAPGSTHGDQDFAEPRGGFGVCSRPYQLCGCERVGGTAGMRPARP